MCDSEATLDVMYAVDTRMLYVQYASYMHVRGKHNSIGICKNSKKYLMYSYIFSMSLNKHSAEV